VLAAATSSRSPGAGTKILLNNTRLHLKRGKRYGVCGHNGCGKSTLMKAIANGQVENFPPPEQLKTVYVEHDIQGDLSDLNLIDYVCAASAGNTTQPPEHDATAAAPRARGARHVASIRAASFASTRASLGRCPSAGRASSSRGRPARAPSIPDLRRARSGRGEGSRGGGAKESISGLSGGWKMKLALCRAILQNADIRGVGRLENADSNDSSNHTNVYACQRDTGSAKPRPPTRPSSTHLSICQVFDIPGRHV